MDPVTLLALGGIALFAVFALFGDQALELAAEVGVLRFPQSPVDDGVPITQGFTPTHHAIDFGAPFDGPAFNCAPGTVAQVHDSVEGDSGRFVIVKGRNEFIGVAWSYSHLDEIEVRVGQDLEPGELIGLIGNSGLTSSHGQLETNREGKGGAHLHFAVLSVPGFHFLDPRPFLGLPGDLVA